MRVEGKLDTSRTWERYRDGERIPGKYGQKKQAKEVERLWPWVGSILKCQMWKPLMGKKLNKDEAISAIESLGDPMQTIILGGGYSHLADGQSSEQALQDVFGQLREFPNFDLCRALVLMLAWADNIGNPDFWNPVCAFYREMIPVLIDREDVPLYSEVFDAIDVYAQPRIFSAVNMPDNRFQSWREELPRYETMKAEQEATLAEYWNNIPKILIG